MKQLLSGLLLLVAVATHAQPGNMVLTVSNAPYVNLTNPTIVTQSDWDDFDADFPLGFNYTLLGSTNDSVFIRADVSQGSDIQLRIDSINTGFGLVIDFMDRVSVTNIPSTIGYEVETVSGKKIAKIQWKDVGFFDEWDAYSTMNDSANIQMWLYEEGHLEFRFGGSRIQSPDSVVFLFKKPIIGIFSGFDPQSSVFDMMYYVSSSSPAVVDSINFSDLNNVPSLGLNGGWPDSGSVFRFSVPVTSVNGVQLNEQISVYPTAFNQQCIIDIKELKGNAVISLISMDGKVVYQQKATEGKNVLAPSVLSSGTYILNVRSNKESVFYKVIKN